ncbi:MAG: mercury methylation ferredoxin HgcB [Pseudomonadota bacterium]
MKYLKDVVTLNLDKEKCTGCKMCIEVCPHAVFIMENKKAKIQDKDLCMECGACALNCEYGAISVKADVGCATALINAKLKGGEVSCDCC